MKNLNNKKSHVLEDEPEELSFKRQFRDEYRRKKETQRAAKERRQRIREMKEDRWYYVY
jgi:hypothetical protein